MRLNRAFTEKQPAAIARRLSRGMAVVALGLALATTGCTKRVDVRGNKPDPDMLRTLVEDKLTREEVTQILGTPSTVALFTNETWLYISQTTEAIAFLEPEVVEQTVVVVQFSDSGEVASVDTLGVEDGRLVSLSEKTTPTLGNELGAIQQMIGNIGRFNVDQ
ncbi:MAG: outer membrane protein assembly factor BamE [Rhodospirillales bacterium]